MKNSSLTTLLINCCFCVSVVLVFPGCGGGHDVGQVTGTVTFDAAPLPGATVTFQPQQAGAPSSGVTDDSGVYTLKYTRDQDGAELGEHSVRISTFVEGDEDLDPPVVAVPEKIPAKYNSATELKATVESGANTFDWALESEGEVYQPGSEPGQAPDETCG